MNFPWLVLGAMGTAAIAAAVARLTRQYALAAVAGAGVILWFHGWAYFHYTSDDAYISYRYARNLAGGLGLVWNSDEYVEGYSNFLWVIALAGVDKLGWDIVFSARWIGFVLAVAAAGGTYALTRELLDDGVGRQAGLVAALLLAASGPFAIYATAGLEGPLFAALTLVAVLLHLRERNGAPPLSGVAWALVAMTRPDGALLVAISGMFKLGVAALAITREDRAAVQPALRSEAARFALWLSGFAVVYGPYFAWRYTTYDYFFVNTYYAKVGGGLDQYARGLRYVTAFSQQHAAWLLLLAPIATALGVVRQGRALYVLALLLAWLGYVVYVGGDSLVRFRFVALVLPLLYALVCASAGALLDWIGAGRQRPRWSLEAAAGVAVAGLLAFTLHASSTDLNVQVERRAVADRIDIGRWLRGTVPSGTTIAVIPAGAIPYESALPTIDMLGINDEHIAHRDLTLGKFAAGHEKYDSAYVLDRQPDIIILTDNLEPAPWTRGDYMTLNALIPARADMLNNPRLWEEYEPRAVLIREGKWFNLLVRHEASAVLAKTQAAAAPPAP